MNRRFYKKKPLTQKNPAPPEILGLSNDLKVKICSLSYLGKKGYTIPKSALTKEEEELLKKDLFVKPMIFGAIGTAESTSFPVFRENANKIYIPRFYGIHRYGMPNRSEIDPGENISVEFVKPLRDYQNEIIKVYTDYVDTPICVDAAINGGGGILEVHCGAGKTVMALKIVSLQKKKTLIIVHKEFLMNQWIERISEFLPTAKVGKIQGSTFDVAGKDIVIGMLQSLYDREFPADAFSVFGLTIIDEVHRIGSEQFSKTLTRIITPYMLGISATVDRKDKLTKVLHMFIGDKIYSKKREDEDPVCVRALTYISNDSEFNETEMDFRGKPKYSTMITKLCAFNSRSEFIIRAIGDLLKESDNQIMILCHNRSLLTYLFQGIMYRNLGTVGYYVGGMKQTNLQETETKQIVLATYAMAAEALDIKSLSTLVMVTPKTDITQSVGRILRVKHENPIIVDIVDSHDLFQNQWTQRRRFYKKCNYRILQTTSTKYKNMDDIEGNEWTKVFEPKNKQTTKNEVDAYDSDASTEMDSNERKCLINIDYIEGL